MPYRLAIGQVTLPSRAGRVINDSGCNCRVWHVADEGSLLGTDGIARLEGGQRWGGSTRRPVSCQCVYTASDHVYPSVTPEHMKHDE